MVTEKYIRHCLAFAHFIEQDFLLMQDNARPHVTKYLDKVNIRRLESHSPDLNAIEYVLTRLVCNGLFDFVLNITFFWLLLKNRC